MKVQLPVLPATAPSPRTSECAKSSCKTCSLTDPHRLNLNEVFTCPRTPVLTQLRDLQAKLPGLLTRLEEEAHSLSEVGEQPAPTIALKRPTRRLIH